MVDAASFVHVWMNECEGSNAVELRITRKRNTRDYTSKLTLYTPKPAGDARPLTAYGKDTEPGPRSW